MQSLLKAPENIKANLTFAHWDNMKVNCFEMYIIIMYNNMRLTAYNKYSDFASVMSFAWKTLHVSNVDDIGLRAF